ncbi:hypothetical protein [uncultured Sphingomonas sp.]|uniref:hypothetical protein n=1 Tax=uncultured Sphingomonas sp. TaxID=158754 RepID=UPI0025E62C76|nr:hypothetical protein [uncultured Sphingomonas sp.]
MAVDARQLEVLMDLTLRTRDDVEAIKQLLAVLFTQVLSKADQPQDAFRAIVEQEAKALEISKAKLSQHPELDAAAASADLDRWEKAKQSILNDVEFQLSHLP